MKDTNNNNSIKKFQFNLEDQISLNLNFQSPNKVVNCF